jgi:hypothetical protein
MQTVAIPQIIERLQELSPDKLVVVYDFVLPGRARSETSITKEVLRSLSDHVSVRGSAPS